MQVHEKWASPSHYGLVRVVQFLKIIHAHKIHPPIGENFKTKKKKKSHCRHNIDWFYFAFSILNITFIILTYSWLYCDYSSYIFLTQNASQSPPSPEDEFKPLSSKVVTCFPYYSVGFY